MKFTATVERRLTCQIILDEYESEEEALDALEVMDLDHDLFYEREIHEVKDHDSGRVSERVYG